MAFAYLGSTSATGNIDTSTSASVDTTGAKIICISASYYTAGTLPITITDSKGNTYIGLTQQIGGVNVIISRIYYCINPIVGSGHTFTVASIGGYPSLQVSYFSSTGTPTFDVQNASINYSTFTSLSCSITPTYDNSLIFSSMVVWNGGGPVTVNAPFTIGSYNVGSGTEFLNANCYYVQPTIASITPEFTWTTLSSDVAQTVASFYEVAIPIIPKSNFFYFFN